MIIIILIILISSLVAYAFLSKNKKIQNTIKANDKVDVSTIEAQDEDSLIKANDKVDVSTIEAQDEDSLMKSDNKDEDYIVDKEDNGNGLVNKVIPSIPKQENYDNQPQLKKQTEQTEKTLKEVPIQKNAISPREYMSNAYNDFFHPEKITPNLQNKNTVIKQEMINDVLNSFKPSTLQSGGDSNEDYTYSNQNFIMQTLSESVNNITNGTKDPNKIKNKNKILEMTKKWAELEESKPYITYILEKPFLEKETDDWDSDLFKTKFFQYFSKIFKYEIFTLKGYMEKQVEEAENIEHKKIKKAVEEAENIEHKKFKKAVEEAENTVKAAEEKTVIIIEKLKNENKILDEKNKVELIELHMKTQEKTEKIFDLIIAYYNGNKADSDFLITAIKNYKKEKNESLKNNDVLVQFLEISFKFTELFDKFAYFMSEARYSRIELIEYLGFKDWTENIQDFIGNLIEESISIQDDSEKLVKTTDLMVFFKENIYSDSVPLYIDFLLKEKKYKYFTDLYITKHETDTQKTHRTLLSQHSTLTPETISS
jgi:hypothetical protein